MANLRFVGESGSSNKSQRKNVASILHSNIPTLRYTGSSHVDKNADIDMFMSAKDFSMLEAMIKEIAQDHYFTLYTHTSKSNYSKAWVYQIYRIVFSEQENDHIDIIIVGTYWYDHVVNANRILYNFTEYHSLPKDMRNILMNTTIENSFYYGQQSASISARDIFSAFLQYSKVEK